MWLRFSMNQSSWESIWSLSQLTDSNQKATPCFDVRSGSEQEQRSSRDAKIVRVNVDSF